MKRIKHVREHLVQDMEHRTNLKELALEHNLSLTQLKDGFRQIYGESPYAYLRSYKMHRAAQLLRQSDKKISEIALEMGYQNPSKFFRGIPCGDRLQTKCLSKGKKVEENHSDTFLDGGVIFWLFGALCTRHGFSEWQKNLSHGNMCEVVKTNQRCRKERNTYENKTYNKGFNYRRRLWRNLFSAAHGVVFSPDHCSNPLSATPLIAGIILGTVYMLYATKVPRTGAILVLAILVGLITSMATIYPLILQLYGD